MRPLVKRSLGAIAVVALVTLSTFAGGTYGFMQGYVHGIGDTSARAAILTTTLRTLRGGDVTEGIALLESDLDTLIMEHWATNHREPPILSWFVHSINSEAADRKLLSRVARYRKEYPSLAVVPEVKDAIESHLKTYRSE